MNEDKQILNVVELNSIDFFISEKPSRVPLLNIAQLYMNLQRPQEAVCYAAAALQIADDGTDHGETQHFYEDYPHRILYWGLLRIGDSGAAANHFSACMGYHPLDLRYLRDMHLFFSVDPEDWQFSAPVTEDEFLVAYKIAGDNGKHVVLFPDGRMMAHKQLATSEKYKGLTPEGIVEQAQLEGKLMKLHGLHAA